MRIAHGLRASAGNQGIVLPNIGDAFEGGYYAGLISHTANGVATHALIVAPRASGYTLPSVLAYKDAQTATTGTQNEYDGAINTAAMSNASHPAALYCADLAINGYSDWYLPSRYELEIAYYNLKPTLDANNTSYGSNSYSVPQRTSAYSTSTPSQTSVALFKSGGAEDFTANEVWSSTEVSFDPIRAWTVSFANGTATNNRKTVTRYVRAFRKIAL